VCARAFLKHTRVNRDTRCQVNKITMQPNTPEQTFAASNGITYTSLDRITSFKVSIGDFPRFMEQSHRFSALVSLDASKLNIGANQMEFFFECAIRGNFQKLQKLNLSRTGLQAPGLRFLCQAIEAGALKSLVELDLSQNYLEFYVPDDDPFMVHGMVYFERAVASGNLSALTALNLSYTGDSVDAMRAFSSAVQTGLIPKLSALRMRGNAIGSNIEKMVFFSRAIDSGNLRNLAVLDFSDNQIDDSSVLFLTLKPSMLDSLAVLNLNENYIGDSVAENIFSALRDGHLPSFTEFHAAHNKIGKIGMQAFEEAVKAERFGGLTILNLSYNQLGDQSMDALAGAIQTGRLSTLRVMDLSGTAITAAAMLILCQKTNHMKLRALQTLNLSNNGFQSDGVYWLARLLWNGNSAALSVLNLRFCEMDDAGMASIATLVEGERLKSLTSLDVSSNHIGDTGMNAFFDAATRERLPVFAVFDWADNSGRLSKTAILHFTDAINRGAFRALRDLNMGFNNSIGPEAIEYLLISLVRGNLRLLRRLTLWNVNAHEPVITENLNTPFVRNLLRRLDSLEPLTVWGVDLIEENLALRRYVRLFFRYFHGSPINNTALRLGVPGAAEIARRAANLRLAPQDRVTLFDTNDTLFAATIQRQLDAVIFSARELESRRMTQILSAENVDENTRKIRFYEFIDDIRFQTLPAASGQSTDDRRLNDLEREFKKSKI
jgi:Leucine-rich repeat (LRR) protein